jgi:hypothetical protein
MSFTYKRKTYSSKKFPMLEVIFDQKTKNRSRHIGENISFTLRDVSRAYQSCGIPEPASISNTILDLTRKDRGIESRLPRSIIDYGYDLRKKTGPATIRENFAGEFVYVGIGNRLKSWLEWPARPDLSIIVPNKVPPKISHLLSNDEGALFSVIDYCDILSHALFEKPDTVIRVQNPMKWQPNEIDGLYFSDYGGEHEHLYPIEGKALSTGDEINLEQMLGAYLTMKSRVRGIHIVPLGIQMVTTGLKIAELKYTNNQLSLARYILVNIEPPIPSWVSHRSVADQSLRLL